MATRTRQQSPTEAARNFAAIARRFPHVQQILLENGQEPCIWTVIAAPPFENDYRYAVYNAQRDLLRRPDTPLLDFRLVNTNEIVVPLDQVVPAQAVLIFERRDSVKVVDAES